MSDLKIGDNVEVLDEGLAMLRKICPDMPPNNQGRVKSFDDKTVMVEFPIDGGYEHSQVAPYSRSIVKLLSVLLLIATLSGPAFCQPVAKIVGPKESPAGEMVVLSSTGSTGDNLKWIKPDNLQTLQVGCTLLDTQVVFATSKVGTYKFVLIVADKEARIDYVEHAVTVGTPKPTPGEPDPKPDPKPDQPSPGKWNDLQASSKAVADRLNDPTTRSKLKAGIAATILDIEGKCASGNCPTLQAAQGQVRMAIEAALLARTGASAQVDWVSWRKSNQDELNRLGLVDLKDYLAAVKAMGSGL